MSKSMLPATALFVLAIILIPTTLYHADVTLSKVLFLTTVYVMLFAVWSGARRINLRSTAFATSLSDEQARQFSLIQLQVDALALFAISGIMVAVATGKMIGTLHHG